MLQMYRNVYATRKFELNCAELYRAGFIRGYLHPYPGEEAIAAGACAAVGEADYIVSTHRDHSHCISKGAELKLIKVKGTRQVVVSFFSDGASNNGVFAESLNLAAVFNLPVIFMLENNHYAIVSNVKYQSLNILYLH
jgi:TPP-dependent pyruvate/acetoin dehydrogenase alpha subunit